MLKTVRDEARQAKVEVPKGLNPYHDGVNWRVDECGWQSDMACCQWSAKAKAIESLLTYDMETGELICSGRKKAESNC